MGLSLPLWLTLPEHKDACHGSYVTASEKKRVGSFFCAELHPHQASDGTDDGNLWSDEAMRLQGGTQQQQQLRRAPNGAGF